MNYDVSLANFNVTFGKEEEPLLKYFDSIVYNALKSDIKREVVNKQTSISDVYFFMDVDLTYTEDMGYVLHGKIVRETELEVKTVVKNDKLIKKNERYPSAPYSVFYIYLKNHRMILIKNQKGSPSIKTFGKTVQIIINKYVRVCNNELREQYLSKDVLKRMFYPFSRVNVVGLPLKDSLRETLKDVKKIQYLKLNFYPLNGDLDIENLVSGVSTEFRKAVGSKTGNILLNSPQSINGIIEMIDKSNGLVDASMRVEYVNKSKKTISNEVISEVVVLDSDEGSINDISIIRNNNLLVDKLLHTSEGNKKIYQKYLDRIKSLYMKE